MKKIIKIIVLLLGAAILAILTQGCNNEHSEIKKISMAVYELEHDSCQYIINGHGGIIHKQNCKNHGK